MLFAAMCVGGWNMSCFQECVSLLGMCIVGSMYIILG